MYGIAVACPESETIRDTVVFHGGNYNFTFLSKQ